MIKKSLLTILLIFSIIKVSAQYYISQKDPAIYKWRQIERKDAGKIIYPDFLGDRAYMVATISDTIRPYITYGLYDLMYKFPISLHPSTILSNGMVTWAPKRMELMTALPTNDIAVPWLTQLTIHESRHVVQMSNLKQGFTKGLSYLLGEQAPGIVAIILPTYFYEGDAVAAETEMTMYGRGLQPKFTISYRAMMNEDNKKLNIGKMKLGSYKDNIPSPYEFGYQVTQFAREYYGANFWENVSNYVGRRSYTIFAYHFALKRYAGSRSDIIIENTFADLKEFWHETSQVENSSDIVEHETDFYTTYSMPLPITSTISLALKESMREPTKFVFINSESGNEKTFKYVGYVTSRPERVGDRIFWTEYRPSVSYGSKDKSEIRYLDLSSYKNKPLLRHCKNVKGLEGDIFFVTSIGEKGYAMLSYDKSNSPSLLLTDSLFHEKQRIPISDPYTAFNGLAWDSQTETLAAIVLDKQGMYLASLSLEDGSLTKLTEPSYVTRSNLRAGGGKLYFNSIASGKDEAHSFDIASRTELQLTTSKYGSSFPTPSSDSTILLSTYTRLGYRVATQKIDSSVTKRVSQTKLPKNIVNYPFQSWDVPKIDTMNLDVSSYNSSSSKKYSKAAHLFNVHSWIPLYLDVDEIISDRNITAALGVSVMSQNILNTVIAGASVGYVAKEGGLVSGHLSYRELPVEFRFKMDYGGGKQLNYTQGLASSDNEYTRVNIGASLPLNFSSGNMLRNLNISTSYNYNNTLYIDPNDFGGYSIKTGIHKLSPSILYQSYTRMANNDISPRFGYFAALQADINPVNIDFGKLYSVYGGVYLPGILRNNSITIKMAYQYQKPNKYNFYQTILFPRGNVPKGNMSHQGALALSYKAPLLYPDLDCLWSSLYIKRLWVDLFGEMAQYRVINNPNKETAYTYGLTLHTNFNLFAITNEIDFALSLFSPSDIKKVITSVGFSIAF